MRAVLLLVFGLLGCATDAADPAAPANETTAPATAPAAAPATATGGTVELRTIATGGYARSEPEAPRAVAVHNAEEYPGIWQQTIGGGTPPQVDFASESVVILLAGMRPSGGYSITARGAKLEGRTLVIDAVINRPPPDAIVTMAFTSPYAVVAVNSKDFDDVRWNP